MQKWLEWQLLSIKYAANIIITTILQRYVPNVFSSIEICGNIFTNVLEIRMNFFSNVTPWYIYKSINDNLLAINIQYGIQADKTRTISKVWIITQNIFKIM